MKTNKLIRCFLVTALIYFPAQSMAWGLLGHRIVGEIAEQYLSGRAHRQVKKILGNESLAMAANWADFIKSEPSYKYLDNWHYINLPAALGNDQLQKFMADTATNAYNKILFLSGELKNRSLPAEQKVMYLRLLIHLVGDVHQPMHTGRFEDLGGNRVQVTWFGQPSNLHRVWDSDLVESQQLSYTEYTKSINFTDRSRLLALSKEDPAKWISDSYAISEKIYANVKSGDKLSYRYIYDYIAVANDQLLKGGIHLAALLNDIFG